MNLNDLALEIYSSGTTRASDMVNDLRRAEQLAFDTFYPGGLFGTFACFIPRDPSAAWPFKAGQRLVVRNGLSIVYEGVLISPGYSAQRERGGRWLVAAGYWGQLLGVRGLRKPWCDTRIDTDAWISQTVTDEPQAGDDRRARIRITPKGVAWVATELYRVRYSVPTGQTIKRVTMDYDLTTSAAAASWTLRLRDNTGAADVWSVSRVAAGSSTGSQDVTLGTPRQTLDLELMSDATQTPVEDGSVYGQITNVKMYTETGSITPTEIAKDWRAAIAEVNSDETQIDSNTLTLEPWVTGGDVDYEMAADNLARLAALGDASFNPWAAYLLESEAAATPNGEPVLAFKQQSALTDYDYALRIDDAALAGLELRKTEVWNWIVVSYRDGEGRTQWLTPDDDANLEDTTSVTTYGQREKILSSSFTSSAVATNFARRFLASNKDEKFYVSGGIPVVGWLRGKQGQVIPASQLRAGKRVKIENYLTDEVGVSAAGLTFIVTRTSYQDAAETCTLECGVSDDLATMIAQLARGQDALI